MILRTFLLIDKFIALLVKVDSMTLVLCRVLSESACFNFHLCMDIAHGRFHVLNQIKYCSGKNWHASRFAFLLGYFLYSSSPTHCSGILHVLLWFSSQLLVIINRQPRTGTWWHSDSVGCS